MKSMTPFRPVRLLASAISSFAPASSSFNSFVFSSFLSGLVARYMSISCARILYNSLLRITL